MENGAAQPDHDLGCYVPRRQAIACALAVCLATTMVVMLSQSAAKSAVGSPSKPTFGDGAHAEGRARAGDHDLQYG